MRYVLTALLLLFPGLFVVASPAHAASMALCTASHPLTIRPGLTLTPANVADSSEGYTGTIDCVGSLNGHLIVGPGTLANHGTINNGTCLQGTGSGEFEVQIPTDPPSPPVVAQYTFQYLGAVGTVSGPVFSGTFEFLPQSGDCVLTPLTKVTVVAQLILTSS